MDIPSNIATESAITRQNFALSALKQNADQAEKFAKVIEETVKTAPVTGSRGTNLNILV